MGKIYTIKQLFLTEFVIYPEIQFMRIQIKQCQLCCIYGITIKITHSCQMKTKS